MIEVKIPLPWPAPILSPNDRSHWSRKATVRKAARNDAYYLTREMVGRRIPRGELIIGIEFAPPDARSRDLDNMIASFKAAQDGIADAIKIDDSAFRPSYWVADPCRPHGRVIVTLTWETPT